MTDAVFIYGQHEYDYTLLKQERKTLSLTVDPSMRIIVKAPVGVDKARIETFLKKKWMWLEKQLVRRKLPVFRKTIQTSCTSRYD